MDRTESIQVQSGKTLRMEFTYFSIYPSHNCSSDYIKITDGDGTTLMDRSCGYTTSSMYSWTLFQPPTITTLTNTVNVHFRTDARYTKAGWSLNWTAVSPGRSKL